MDHVSDHATGSDEQQQGADTKNSSAAKERRTKAFDEGGRSHAGTETDGGGEMLAQPARRAVGITVQHGREEPQSEWSAAQDQQSAARAVQKCQAPTRHRRVVNVLPPSDAPTGNAIICPVFTRSSHFAKGSGEEGGKPSSQ